MRNLIIVVLGIFSVLASSCGRDDYMRNNGYSNNPRHRVYSRNRDRDRDYSRRQDRDGRYNGWNYGRY
jgi:hypothetical protein